MLTDRWPDQKKKKRIRKAKTEDLHLHADLINLQCEYIDADKLTVSDRNVSGAQLPYTHTQHPYVKLS